MTLRPRVDGRIMEWAEGIWSIPRDAANGHGRVSIAPALPGGQFPYAEFQRMSDAGPANAAGFAGRPFRGALQRLRERFEEAWQKRDPPLIHDFLAAVPNECREAPDYEEIRREFLGELITVDLQYRWMYAAQGHSVGGAGGSRETLPARPLLEDYLRLYPELGTPTDLPAGLIAEEYRIRRCWGDRPAHGDYVRRFGENRTDLLPALFEVDRDAEADDADQNTPEPDSDPAAITLIMEGVAPQAWAHTIPSRSLRLGRAEDAEIRITHPSISRYHCRFWRTRDGCYIEDMGSTNGTFVNRRRITKHRLTPGDRLLVGTFDLLAIRPEALRSSAAAKAAARLLAERPQLPDETTADEEQRLAAEVHYRLTPSRRLSIPGLLVEVGNRPSGQLGGDCFVCLEKGDHWVLAVFDAMTHGTKSALMIMLLRAEMDRWISLSDSPSECMTRINAELHALQLSDLYICASLAVWYPRRRMMVVSTAGHHPPLVIRQGVRLDLARKARGLPLGVNPNEQYTERLLPLKTDDRLFLFTNGLLDLFSRRQPDEAPTPLLTARLLRYQNRDLTEQVQQVLHTGADELEDDLLLVGCEVFETPPPQK